MQSLWWQVFDVLGTIAFALSGTLVAVSHRMDIFGVFVLSAATAIGGGIFRDIIVGNIPPVAFRSGLYIYIILFTMIIMSVIIRYFNIRRDLMGRLKFLYLISDAVGLGSFTVTGTLLGCTYYPDMWVLAITLGVVTAVGGGVLRDTLSGQIPVIFMRDIYASASIAGAIILYVLLIVFNSTLETAGFISFIVTVMLRLLAVHFHFSLPRVRRKRRSDFL